jgi:branched-chain amino acid transport system substrate-binding protein
MKFSHSLLATVALGLAGVAQAQTQVVKIGHVAPTSGGQTHLGKDNENGARMAVDELNAKGVMIGGKKVRIELVAEDDAGDAKQGTAVAQKLVDMKVNGVVGHLNSGTSIPASNLYSAAGIPQISPSATAVAFTNRGLKSVFRVVANDGQLGGTLGRYAVNTLKASKIAVIDDRTAYGQGLAEEFAKAVKAAGGTVVDTQYTTHTATDFNAILTAIKSKKPDLIFFGGMDNVAGPMIRQTRALGIKAKFMGGDGICSAALPKLASNTVKDDVVYCAEAGGVEGEYKAGLDKFKADYKAKFNAEVQIYAPYVYDAVNVLVAAMQKAGSADPAKYLSALAKTDGYKGVTGTIGFDERGDIKNGTLTIYTYRAAQRHALAVVR